MPSAPEAALAKMIDNLKAKSGKSLAEWLMLVRPKLPMKHSEIIKWLKAEHGMSHGYANLVAHEALESSASHAKGQGQDLIALQYSGAKAPLRAWYDQIIAKVLRFGSDIEIAPKKAYVSLRRTKQFALIQSTTSARIDIGIQLKGVKPAGRLEASGSFNSMVTHRIRIEDAKSINRELFDWLKQAYDAS